MFFKSKLDMNFATGLPLLFSSLIIDSKSSHAMPLAKRVVDRIQNIFHVFIFLDINSGLFALLFRVAFEHFQPVLLVFFNLSNFFNAMLSG